MKSLDKILNYLIVVVVVSIAASFFYFNSEKNSRTKNFNGADASAHDVNDVVNKYIQQAHDQNAINKIKTENALNEARKKILEDRKAFQAKQEQEIQAVPREKQIWREDEIKKKYGDLPTVVLPPKSPTYVNEDDRLDVSKMTNEEKREYARQFIENAKQGGYQIELSEDLEVIRAVPIRRPSQYNDSTETAPSD